MLTHMKTHRLKYLSFVVISILVAFVVYKLFKAQADTTPVFQGYVGTPVPFSPGDHQAPLDYVTAIVFDADGNMYASANLAIQKYDSNGNFLWQTGRAGTGDGEFCFVEGIAIHTYGSTTKVFAGDSCNARVQVFDVQGNYLSQFAVATSGYAYTTGVAVKSTGEIYVGDCGTANAVKKFDANGNYLATVISSGSGNGEVNCPYYMKFDANDNFYVADSNNARIQKFNANNNYVLKVSIADPDYLYPQGVGVDAQGNIFVPNYDTIFKFDSTGTLIASYGGSGLGQGNNEFNYPQDVAVDVHGNIFVADTSNYRILKFDSAFGYQSKWVAGRTGGGNGEFKSPFDAAHDSLGNIYVSDTGNNRIQKFDSQGNFLLSWGSEGSGNGQFSSPHGIVVNSQNQVYVADTGNQRIQKFDTNGTFLSTWGSYGSGDGQFGNYYGQSVWGLAVDTSDNIYEIDLGRFDGQKFDSNGNFLMKFGHCCGGPGGFAGQGITVDSGGYIYIADSNNSRVEKFDPTGTYVGEFTSLNGTLGFSAGISIDAQDNLYLADTKNGRVVKFSTSGVYDLTFTTTNQLVQPIGIDILPDGRAVVVDALTHLVSIYGPASLVISSISATSTATSTQVSFTTDDLGTTQVEFGPSTAYGSTTPIINTSPKVTSHSITLSGLASCALYNYRVKSANDTSTTTSPNYTFITDDCTGMASSTATTAGTASTTATSTVSLSTISLSIPPDFATTSAATTTFQAVKLEPTAFFASSSVPEGQKSASLDVFHLTALTSATTTLTTFTAPITVTLSYDPNNLVGIDQSTLKIYRYDEGMWNVLSNCTRDPVAHTVTCETTHFSDFTLFGSPDSSFVTYGASGYVNPPDGHLTSTPPVSGGASGTTTPIATTTPPQVTTTVSTVKPVITPVKTQPKPGIMLPKVNIPVGIPAKGTTTKATTTLVKATSTLSRPPLTTVRPPVIIPVDVTPLPEVPVQASVEKKGLIETILEFFRGWRVFAF